MVRHLGVVDKEAYGPVAGAQDLGCGWDGCGDW